MYELTAILQGCLGEMSLLKPDIAVRVLVSWIEQKNLARVETAYKYQWTTLKPRCGRAGHLAIDKKRQLRLRAVVITVYGDH